MRMFAGPNGSGKSTLKPVLPKKLLGYYINPDDLEKEIRDGGLDLRSFGVKASTSEIQDFYRNSSFLMSLGLNSIADRIELSDGILTFASPDLNSYCASVLSDFLRRKLIENKSSFTFETVMSSHDKVDLLKQARSQGYRTYLYYIATDDPSINVSRVRNRVKAGGHSVPEDKIVSRYKRSLELLVEAIQNSDRAFIFDNSLHQQGHTWLAEFLDGRLTGLKSAIVPTWFKKAVIDKMAVPPSSI